ARAARYDRKSKRLVIGLANGAAFIIPIHLLQGFEGAAARDVAAVEVTPRGSALHWEKLDLDFSVAELVAGIFGNKAWMSALGRQGGLLSPKQRLERPGPMAPRAAGQGRPAAHRARKQPAGSQSRWPACRNDLSGDIE